MTIGDLDLGDYAVHRAWMQEALQLAQQAGEAGEVPVGAILVDAQGQCLAQATNRRQRDHDPTAHAELLALRDGGKALRSWYLNHCTLYVTLEPCPMCAGALLQARLGRLVYGANDPKTGAIRTVINVVDSPASQHGLSVVAGVCEAECRQQLQTWFRQRRASRMA